MVAVVAVVADPAPTVCAAPDNDEIDAPSADAEALPVAVEAVAAVAFAVVTEAGAGWPGPMPRMREVNIVVRQAPTGNHCRRGRTTAQDYPSNQMAIL